MLDHDAAPSCASCRLGIHALLGKFADEHLESLERAKVVRDYSRGQIICQEGDPADALYCIHSGYIKLYKSCHHGDEVVIRLLRPGDLIGLRPLFALEALAATARAVSQVMGREFCC